MAWGSAAVPDHPAYARDGTRVPPGASGAKVPSTIEDFVDTKPGECAEEEAAREFRVVPDFVRVLPYTGLSIPPRTSESPRHSVLRDQRTRAVGEASTADITSPDSGVTDASATQRRNGIDRARPPPV